jgi:hypothetical protein
MKRNVFIAGASITSLAILCIVSGTLITKAEVAYPAGDIEGECYADDTSVRAGETVTWTADVRERENRSYEYEWSGTDNFYGSGSSADMTYYEPGTKSAHVTVYSYSNENETENPTYQRTIECRNRVEVREAQLAGSCSVYVDQAEDTTIITWSTNVSGGDLEYDFNWYGTDGLEGSDSSVSHEYESDGIKLGRVVVRSGGQEMVLECRAELPESKREREEVGGSCDVHRVFVDEGESSDDKAMVYEWRASGWNTDGDLPTYRWSGTDGLEGSGEVVEKRYRSQGLKDGIVRIRAGGSSLVLGCQVKAVPQEEETGSGSGCFIATAAYGSEYEEEVEALRKFRDTHLLTNAPGKAFVDTYYDISPSIAEFIEDKEVLKVGVRELLRPAAIVAELLN